MLSIGNRVRRTDERFECDSLGLVGSVKKCSPFGYVTVLWDNGIEDRYSPMSAATQLRKVEGDEALSRHDWNVDLTVEDPPCRKCKIVQSDENEFEPCRG
jgi:hypothetical protein